MKSKIDESKFKLDIKETLKNNIHIILFFIFGIIFLELSLDKAVLIKDELFLVVYLIFLVNMFTKIITFAGYPTIYFKEKKK